MNEKNTGGPAFPHDDRAQPNDRAGMTLRDYFAAKAMQYWLALPMTKEQLDRASTEAYKVADAMLEARK